MSNANVVKRGSSSLLILFVVFVFVLCSLFLILYGAHVYASVRDRVDVDFSHRMGVSYITNKLRACDMKGGVAVMGDAATLRLCTAPDDPSPQYMYIYHYDGSIMEYTTQFTGDFDPYDGEIIMAADSLIIRQVPGGLRFHLGIGDKDISYTVSLKST